MQKQFLRKYIAKSICNFVWQVYYITFCNFLQVLLRRVKNFSSKLADDVHITKVQCAFCQAEIAQCAII